MTQRRRHERAIDGHLGHAAVDVVAVLAAVASDVRGEHFLQGGEGAGCEHLGAEGVGLELVEVGLGRVLAVWYGWVGDTRSGKTYGEVALSRLAACQSLAYGVEVLMFVMLAAKGFAARGFAGDAGPSLADGFFLELEGHCCDVLCWYFDLSM